MNGKSIEGFRSGGSVATYAFSFACHLGFRKVVFVGQDLAYTDNKSHADGTFQEKMPEENTEKFLMVPGNYQKKCQRFQIWTVTVNGSGILSVSGEKI